MNECRHEWNACTVGNTVGVLPRCSGTPVPGYGLLPLLGPATAETGLGLLALLCFPMVRELEGLGI